MICLRLLIDSMPSNELDLLKDLLVSWSASRYFLRSVLVCMSHWNSEPQFGCLTRRELLTS